jgi:hypothetical protein
MGTRGNWILRRSAVMALCAILAALSACKLDLIASSTLIRAKDSTAPVITISSPQEGFLCANIVEIDGKVSDAAADGQAGSVASLSYEIPSSTVGGDVAVAADGSYSFQFATDTLGASFYLKLKAVDWNSNVSSSSINLKKSSTGSSLPSFAAVASNKKIVLSWDDVPNTDSYTLYYSDTGSLPSDTVGSVIKNVTSPYSLKCANGNLYVVRVKANAKSGYPDSYSDYVKTIPLSARTLIPRLYGMRGKIDLNWNGIVATDEYTIYRRIGDTGTFDEFRTTTGTSFSDTTVVNGLYYYYKIAPKSDCNILSSAVGGQTDGFLTSPSVTRCEALGEVRELAWLGDYLYAVNISSGLKVYNAKDKANPVLLKTIAMPSGGLAYQVIVHGNYAYVAAGAAGLLIYDLSSPGSPAKLGQYAAGIACARGLAVYGSTVLVADFSFTNVANATYGYVTYYASSVKMIDVSLASAPVLRKSFILDRNSDMLSNGYILTSEAKALGIAVYGDYAIVADRGGGLKVIRLGDADGSGAIQSFRASDFDSTSSAVYSQALSVAISGDYAYAAMNNNGIMVVDLSGLAAGSTAVLKSCQAYGANGRIQDLAASGQWLFTANTDLGIQIYRLDDPSSPSLQKNIPTDYPCSVSVNGPLAFALIDLTDPCQCVIDTNLPLSLTKLAVAATSGGACDVAIGGSHAYVAENTAGLRIFDIGDPANPVQTALLATPAYKAAMVRLSGDLAFVMAASTDITSPLQEVLVVDVSDPAKPTIMAKMSTSYLRGIAISGSYLYFTTRYSGFEIYDISNPSSPAFIKTILASNGIQDISISGTYAYIADSNQGVNVYDISSPSAAFFCATIPVAGARAICTSETGAFTNGDSYGFSACDISDPLSATKVASFSSANEVGKGLAQTGHYLFASSAYNSSSGLCRIRIVDLSKAGKASLLASCESDYDSTLNNENGNFYASANGLAVSGPYLYSAVGTKGLYVYKLKP